MTDKPKETLQQYLCNRLGLTVRPCERPENPLQRRRKFLAAGNEAFDVASSTPVETKMIRETVCDYYQQNGFEVEDKGDDGVIIRGKGKRIVTIWNCRSGEGSHIAIDVVSLFWAMLCLRA